MTDESAYLTKAQTQALARLLKRMGATAYKMEQTRDTGSVVVSIGRARFTVEPDGAVCDWGSP